jgi:pimeloyl-ACP methyl ester carboxylesterase
VLNPPCRLAAVHSDGNIVRAPWRAERIDGVSHFLMLDQPQRVTDLILDFFKEAKTK